MGSLTHYQVFESGHALSLAAARFIAQTIEQCLQQQPVCRIALPGGTTPAVCLTQLASLALPWSCIDWYMGDERCLPIGDPERNDSMIKTTLLKENPLAMQRFYPIQAEKGADEAARAYADLIAGFEYFDLVILGMGEDGHTASLFPGNPALDDTRSVVPVYNAPKPPSERVSLSLPTLQQAHKRVVLAAGQSKRSALKQIKSGDMLPVNRIGENCWYVDRQADQ